MEGALPPEGSLQSGPYNLLLTRRWMLLVPRSQEFVVGASVNALGFAGALLVRDEEQKRRLLEIGPLESLARVGYPPQGGRAC